MEIRNPSAVPLKGERFLADREFPRALTDAECRRLRDSVLTAAQLFHLETEHWVQVEVQLGAVRGRIFATSRNGDISALLTA